MKHLILAAAMVAGLHAQNTVRWVATSGDVPLVSAASAATIQQPATNASIVYIDQIVIYCSVACNASQASGGTAATTTAGSVQPIQPNAANVVIPFNFFTASNVGAGTTQGGLIHIPAGGTITLCLSPSCGAAAQVILPVGSTATNYTASIASITGTVNFTFYGRVAQ